MSNDILVKVLGDKTEIWCRDPKNGPTVVGSDGTKLWFKDGKYIEGKRNILHREDGPAIETKDGKKYWFVDGKFDLEKSYDDLSSIDLQKQLMLTVNIIKQHQEFTQEKNLLSSEKREKLAELLTQINETINKQKKYGQEMLEVFEKNTLHFENCTFTPENQIGMILDRKDIKPEEVEDALKSGLLNSLETLPKPNYRLDKENLKNEYHKKYKSQDELYKEYLAVIKLIKMSKPLNFFNYMAGGKYSVGEIKFHDEVHLKEENSENPQSPTTLKERVTKIRDRLFSTNKSKNEKNKP